MKKYISTIVVTMILFSVLLLLYSCANQTNPDENGVDTVRESGGAASYWMAISIRNIEELENTLIISRYLAKNNIENFRDFQENFLSIQELQSLYNISDNDIRAILANNISQITNYYNPIIQFDEFELIGIDFSAWGGHTGINYSFMPIGEPPLNFNPSNGIGIFIRFENLGGEMRDLMAPLVNQRGIPLTEDGLLYESRRGHREIVRQIENTTIRMRITIPSDFGDYEFLRDFALSEFVPANIMCVDELIERRSGERREGIHLLPALTEEHTGNNVRLHNLEVSASISAPVLIGGDTLTVEFSARNTSNRIKSVQFILALHDAADALIDVSMQELLIPAGALEEVYLHMPIPGNTDGLHLRVMVWDSYVSDAPHTVMTVRAE